MTLKRRTSLLFALACVANSALAEEAARDRGPWQVTLGAGVMSRPEYPGSDSQETRALPLLNVRYKRFFLGGAPGSGSPGGLGMYLYEDETWSLGAVASRDVTEPREESDDARLRGLGDIDPTTRAGLFANYRVGWLSLSASAFSDVGGNEQGTVANFDAKATYRPLPRLQLSAGPGVTWANEEYMRTFFGISPEQADRSAFAPYEVSSGISLVRFSFGAQYQLTRHWGLGANVTAARLQGDASDSPIVEDENQNSYALFFMYRF